MRENDAELRGYAICTAPRSGSNHLCEALASTGVLGRPTEWFNALARRAGGDAEYSEDPEAQLERIMIDGRTPNGVYGLKIFAYQSRQVWSTRWWARLPGLQFIHLERDDLLGQAVSSVRAHQTQQWRSHHIAKGEPVYDGKAIATQLKDMLNEQMHWRMLFARTDWKPLRVRHEVFREDPQATVDALAKLVGVAEPAVIDPSKIKVRVQRDTINADWRKRFVSEYGDPTKFY